MLKACSALFLHRRIWLRFDSSVSRKTWSHCIFTKEQFKFLTVFVAKLMRWQCTPWNMGSNQPTTMLKANADSIMVALFCCTWKTKMKEFFTFFWKRNQQRLFNFFRQGHGKPLHESRQCSRVGSAVVPSAGNLCAHQCAVSKDDFF